MTPGSYIRERRVAAGLSIEDLALRVETVPAVSARQRGEMLTAIEDGFVPVRLSTAIALSVVGELQINLAQLAELVDGRTADELRFVIGGLDPVR